MLKKFPHTYVIVFAIIIISGLLTWIIPGGSFQRESLLVNGVEREIIKNNSFEYAQNEPQSWQIFTSLYTGFENQAGIIIFILIIGGAFWIVNATHSIDKGIGSFLRLTQKAQRFSLFKAIGVNNVLFIMIMLVFSLFGAVFGMSEETIAFVIIFVPLSIKLGYDSITGVAISYLAAHVGFAGAMLNPFTIGIAQGIAQVPLFSGIEYRFFCWIVVTFIAIAFVLWYAARIKKNPKLSPVYSEDELWRKQADSGNNQIDSLKTKQSWVVFSIITSLLIYLSIVMPISEVKIGGGVSTFPVMPVITGIFLLMALPGLFKSVHYFIVSLLFLTILLLVAGVMSYGWYIGEISGLFLALGIAAGWSYGYGTNSIVKNFLDGARDILSAAIIVGLAGGIIVILKDGQIIDTILYNVSQSMNDAGKLSSVGIMYGIQTFINVIIPSGSAKAALTMPIMAQFSDLIGISRQATVMAFQFGDGFTNMITPTSGVLLGVLGIARIPYQKWFKWIWPFMLFLIILGFVLLIPTVFMELNGF